MSTPSSSSTSPGIGRAVSVVIVGGGISGLYCAEELSSRGFEVTVLETRSRFGGRIQTEELGGFKAECGPMRFEEAIQPLFAQLCERLEIHRVPFAEPTDPMEPPTTYQLDGDELSPDGRALQSLNLLRLGVFRLFGKHSEPVRDGDDKPWVVRLTPDDSGWLDSLGDENGEFDNLRRSARLLGDRSRPFLNTMGFWNALEEVLSHQAVMKIRDQGTFYHLIPDNPNAVEWAIFWLRLFKLRSDEKLSTIPEGVSTITTRLLPRLSGSVSLQESQEVTAIRHGSRPFSIALDVIDKRQAKNPRPYSLESDHVILALPKSPLQKLSEYFPTDVQRYLDSVIGFPLLKAFLVMRRPAWWPGDRTPGPQENAWTVPTRELHYTDSGDGETAMVMLYTDHPATEYWKQFVMKPEDHDRAEINRNSKLRRELVRLLLMDQEKRARRFGDEATDGPDLDGPTSGVLTSREPSTGAGAFPRLRRLASVAGTFIDRLTIPADVDNADWKSVIAYCIRDWSQEPFGAGCHAWRPGARSWEVRDRLKAFGLVGRDERSADSTSLEANPRNVHICGEAYSDYQGFIEGSLRSACEVLEHMIPGFSRGSSSR